MSGDDGQGFIDLSEVDLRGRYHGRRETRHPEHASTKDISPTLRGRILTRSLHDGREHQGARGGEIARPAGRILLGRKVATHRRLDEQDDEPVFGFVAGALQGRAEGRDLRRRELAQRGHGKVKQGHA